MGYDDTPVPREVRDYRKDEAARISVDMLEALPRAYMYYVALHVTMQPSLKCGS